MTSTFELANQQDNFKILRILNKIDLKGLRNGKRLNLKRGKKRFKRRKSVSNVEISGRKVGMKLEIWKNFENVQNLENRERTSKTWKNVKIDSKRLKRLKTCEMRKNVNNIEKRPKR